MRWLECCHNGLNRGPCGSDMGEHGAHWLGGHASQLGMQAGRLRQDGDRILARYAQDVDMAGTGCGGCAHDGAQGVEGSGTR